MLVPDFQPESLYSYSRRYDFDLHHTQGILPTGIEKNFTVISFWHPHQVIHLLFAPGTTLWCDSQQGDIRSANAICIIFQGWKPTSGYNNCSLEKSRGKSIPNNTFRVVIQVFITLLQGHPTECGW